MTDGKTEPGHLPMPDWWGVSRIFPVNTTHEQFASAQKHVLDSMQEAAGKEGYTHFGEYMIDVHNVYRAIGPDEVEWATDRENFMTLMSREPTDKDVVYLWFRYMLRVSKEPINEGGLPDVGSKHVRDADNV